MVVGWVCLVDCLQLVWLAPLHRVTLVCPAGAVRLGSGLVHHWVRRLPEWVHYPKVE